MPHPNGWSLGSLQGREFFIMLVKFFKHYWILAKSAWDIAYFIRKIYPFHYQTLASCAQLFRMPEQWPLGQSWNQLHINFTRLKLSVCFLINVYKGIPQCPRADLNKRFLPRPNTTSTERLYPIGLISARIKILHIGNFFTK